MLRHLNRSRLFQLHSGCPLKTSSISLLNVRSSAVNPQYKTIITRNIATCCEKVKTTRTFTCGDDSAQFWYSHQKLRLDRGVSQFQLAELVGLSEDWRANSRSSFSYADSSHRRNSFPSLSSQLFEGPSGALRL